MGVAIPQVIAFDRASGAKVFDGSLAFSGSDQKLERTPGSTGNVQTWTWSGWVKIFKENQEHSLFSAHTGSSDRLHFRLSSGQIQFAQNTGSWDFDIRSKALLRDIGWYHIVAIADFTNSTQNDRARLYVNGERQPLATNTLPSNTTTNTIINAQKAHYIGEARSSTDFFGRMTEVYLIDGQALEPEYFGFTDPLTNNWKPKKVSVTGPNDGRIWTNTATISSGSNAANKPLSNGFDGSTATAFEGDTSGATVTVPVSATISAGGVRVFAAVTSGNPLVVAIKNGSTTEETINTGSSGGKYYASSSYSGPITSLVISRTGRAPEFNAIEINGTMLIDGDRTNFGSNGFYLPFDGNSPIGEDKSGRGNDWTPVNFGGSVALDNPQVSGARPILNVTQGGAQAGVGVRTDAYFDNIALAVPFVGNTDDVSHLVNSSQSQKADTNSGSTASTESNFYGGSRDFDGSNDTCSFASVGACGSGDWTVEFWVYSEASGIDNVYRRIVSTGTNATSAIQIGHIGSAAASGGYITYTHSDNSVYAVNTSNVLNRWAHIAVVRESGSVNVYTDGIKGTTADSDTNNKTGTTWYVSGYGGDDSSDPGGRFNGKIQDLRVYPGIAKYTSNFVVPSTNPDILPDTPSGVSGGSNLTKITEGAVTFDGTGDYLEISDNANFEMGTDDFTIECFIYNQEDTTQSVVTKYGDNVSNRSFWLGTLTSQRPSFYWYNGSNSYNIDGAAGTLPLNKWSHVVAQRTSGDIYLFVDGQLVASNTGANAAKSFNDLSEPVVIGSDSYSGGNDSPFEGILSNVRIVKGTGVYSTSGFIPPTAPLTNVTNTKLLCCQSNSSANSATVTPGTLSNSGTTYSSNLSGAIAGSPYDATQMFDGSLSTYTDHNAQNSTITWTQTLTSVTSLKVYIHGGNSTNTVTTVGGDGTQTDTISTDFGPGWHTISLATTGSTINSIAFARGGSGNFLSIYAVEVNGTVLIDNFYGETVARGGDAAATNFNPFITDIHTVRGQESGYATLNPLIYGAAELTDSNLTATAPSGNTHGTARSTLSMDTSGTGKFYFEARLALVGGTYAHIGVLDTLKGSDANYVGNTTNCFSYRHDGKKQLEGNTAATYGDSFTTGDTIGCSLDCGSGELRFYKNGVDQGVATTITADFLACFAVSNYGSSGQWKANFGQKPFKFPPPDGFQPLNAANVRPVKIFSRPDQYVGVTTYIGTGSSGIRIDTGIKADLILLKDLSENRHWGWFDTQRGKGKIFYPADGSPSSSTSADILNFLDDGFTYADDDRGNTDDSTYAVWSWKAGGYIDNNGGGFFKDGKDVSNATNAGLTGGDITPSSASIGTKQGFSIVRYAGTNNASAQTIPHGLSQKPDFMVIKQETDNNTDWIVYFSALGATKFFKFNSTNNADVSSDAFNNTEPTASLFTVGSGYNNVNRVSRNFSSYHWHNIPGLQKFGKYTGNGQTDGTFVELGFRPKIIWIRPDKDGENWMIIDSERYKFNKDSMEKAIFSTTKPSLDTGSRFDFVSNGFKFKNNGNNGNASGVDYYYCAWADVPSFDLYGGGANAR